MISPPVIEDEDARLASVASLRLLDTPASADFDELVELAAWTCHVPIAAISLLDADRQWFKAIVGLDVPETDRDVAFCAHTIAQDQTLIVPDALLDPRFVDNPFVTGDTEIRFYAGVPIIIDDGQAVGTLCVLDTRPRSIFADERRALEIIARQAADRLVGVRLEWNALDALTGLSAPVTAERWIHEQRTDRARAALHIDIDDLAGVNARHGDDAGDRALVATASRLRAAAPDGSIVARVGDDEFAVLLDGAATDDLRASVDTLRAAFADHDHGVSMGLATAEPGDAGDDLIDAAARATALEKALRRDG